jgi:uncharacterized membrane protein YbhN (UPF0104 family)
VLRVRGWRLRRPTPRLALAQLTVSCLDWAIFAGTLWLLIPPEARVSFPMMLGITILSFVAGVISSVPGGLGIFESAFILLMPPESERTVLLGALLAFRALYYFIPLIVAALLLGGYEALRGRATAST